MDAFSGLLDSARADARKCCAVVSNATTLLAQRPATEIIAAHLIRRWSSDDDFDYFRAPTS